MTELMMHLACHETFRDGRAANLSPVTQMLLRQLPEAERPRYAFDETDEALDKEPLAEWWAKEAATAVVRWKHALGIVDEPERAPRAPAAAKGADDDDDDDEFEWE